MQRQQEELASNLAQEPALQAAAVQAGESLAACRADLDDQWQALTARLGRDYARDHQAAAQAIRAQVRQADQEVATAAAAAERLPRDQAQVERWQSNCTKLRAEVEQQLTALDAAIPPHPDRNAVSPTPTRNAVAPSPPVIPAKAGIYTRQRTLSPTSPGGSFTRSRRKSLDSTLSKRQWRSKTPCSGAARRTETGSKPWQTDTGWPRRRLKGPAA